MVNKKVQRIKFIVAIIVVLCAAIAIIVRIHIYNKSGEKNMPYSVSKVIIISTAGKDESAEETSDEESNGTWNFDIVQHNDIYVELENNRAKDSEAIKKITIENIDIVGAPKVGALKAYMPNSLDGNRYLFIDDYEIINSLTYRGADESSYKDLQINRKGGILGISFANKELGKYSSGEDTEVTYDGKMLSKIGVSDEDVKSKVEFDIIIELDDGKKYIGRLSLNIKCEGLVENGTSQLELTHFSDVIFRRM